LNLQLIFRFTLVVFLFFTFNLFSQSLIINEVSQGPSGNKEFVEFLVVPGTGPYQCSSYCLDIRGWIIDDNNGYFSGGPITGSGIAAGAVRFSLDSFWSCIPIGTLIVIYNSGDVNDAIPVNDFSMTDGNCKLILPVTSSLLESQTSSPTTFAPASSLYPITGWSSPPTLWSPLGMSNTDDSFQIYNSNNTNVPVFGVSWGNNTFNNIISFSGSATNRVYFFANTIDNNPSNQANWTSGTCSAPDNQTPGLPNNTANAAYISSLNNNCAGPLVVTLISSTDASNCLCNGQASVNAAGSIPGYTYAWYNASFVSIGQNTASATNLCAGTYSCVVSSSINCLDTLLVTINNTTTPITPTFNPIAPICSGGTINLPTTSANGITGAWSPAVNNTQTTTYTFIPTAGQCAATTTLQVSVGAPQTPTFASVGPYCSGASFSLPSSSIEGFTGSWSPAIVSTATTNYSFTPSVGQCATTTNLSVTINPIPTVTILENPTICAGQTTVLTTQTSNPGGSFAWTPDGQTTATISVNPATTTSYSVVYTVSGCASSASNSSVTVNSIVTPTFNPIAPICSGGTINLPTTSTNGITGAWSPAINNVNTTNYTFLPISGQCANSASMNVTIIQNQVSNSSITICSSQIPFIWNGLTFNLAGSQSANLTATSGCDSVATLNLSIYSAQSSSTNITVCQLQIPYVWNGLTFNGPDSQTINLQDVNGCDSSATLSLQVSNTLTSSSTISICPSDLPFSWNGLTFSTAGSQTATLQSFGGCDSLATLTLGLSPTYNEVENVTICSNETPYFWNGLSLSSTTSQMVTLSSINGCDSAVTLNLSVLPVYTTNLDSSVCQNELPLIWNGLIFNATGTQTITLNTVNSCDSIITMNLQVSSILSSTNSISICENQLPYTWNGLVFNTAGTQTATLLSNSGCDSSATLNLIVSIALNSSTDQAICTNELPYIWNGLTFNGSGSQSITLTNVNGCDSIAILNLTVNTIPPAPVVGNDSTYCQNDIPEAIFAVSTGSIFWYSDQNLTDFLSDGSTYLPSQNSGTTEYFATQLVNGCQGPAASVIITFDECSIIIPTAFTPDGDNANDTWELNGIDQIFPKNKVYIYNRWGNLIFESAEGSYESNSWNGVYNNELMPVGTYYFIIEYNDGNRSGETGIVSLIK
jgi:gliding motility-associated-like protein